MDSTLFLVMKTQIIFVRRVTYEKKNKKEVNSLKWVTFLLNFCVNTFIDSKNSEESQDESYNKSYSIHIF